MCFVCERVHELIPPVVFLRLVVHVASQPVPALIPGEMKTSSYGKAAAVVAASNFLFFLSLCSVTCTERSDPALRVHHDEFLSENVPEINHRSHQRRAPGQKAAGHSPSDEEHLFEGRGADAAKRKQFSRLRMKKKSTSICRGRSIAGRNVFTRVFGKTSTLLSAVTIFVTVILLWRLGNVLLRCLERAEAGKEQAGAPGSSPRLLGDQSENEGPEGYCDVLVSVVEGGNVILPLTGMQSGSGSEQELWQGRGRDVQAAGSAEEQENLLTRFKRHFPLRFLLVVLVAFAAGLAIGLSGALSAGAGWKTEGPKNQGGLVEEEEDFSRIIVCRCDLRPGDTSKADCTVRVGTEEDSLQAVNGTTGDITASIMFRPDLYQTLNGNGKLSEAKEMILKEVEEQFVREREPPSLYDFSFNFSGDLQELLRPKEKH